MVKVKVIWQPLAIQDLQDIYDYYLDVASVKFAKELRKKLIDSSKYLSKHPEMGQVEENPKLSGRNYRYLLVEENYKLLYVVSETKVYIIGIFDTRQSPEKMV